MLLTDPPLLHYLLLIIKLLGGNWISVKFKLEMVNELEVNMIVEAEVVRVAVMGINDKEFTGIITS